MNRLFGGEREVETRERVACGLELIRALDLEQMSEEAGMGLAYLIDTLQAALRATHRPRSGGHDCPGCARRLTEEGSTLTRCQTTSTIMTAAQRRQEVLKLRIQGETFPEIGRKLGITKQAAHHHVSKALGELAKANKDRTAELRMLEGERLDAMACVLWPRATDPQNPDLVAVDRMSASWTAGPNCSVSTPRQRSLQPPRTASNQPQPKVPVVYYMPKPCETEEEWLEQCRKPEEVIK